MHLTAPSHWSRSIGMGGRDVSEQVVTIVVVRNDWRMRGRPHPVFVVGGLALIAVKVLNWPVSMSPVWHSFAGGILALAQ